MSEPQYCIEQHRVANAREEFLYVDVQDRNLILGDPRTEKLLNANTESLIVVLVEDTRLGRLIDVKAASVVARVAVARAGAMCLKIFEKRLQDVQNIESEGVVDGL